MFELFEQALQTDTAAADATGTRAPRSLPPQAASWVASKRSQLTQLMWKAAGIVRNNTDLKAALHQLAGLYVETRALRQVTHHVFSTGRDGAHDVGLPTSMA